MIKNHTHNKIIEEKAPSYKIGIPRALHFYKFGPLWHAFLEKLGHQLLYSSPTSSTIVEKGSQNANSELCIPMKIYYGHILKLIEDYPDLDYIFIPRYVSTHNEQFYCPKFLALPEAIKHSLRVEVPILTLDFNVKEKSEKESLIAFANKLSQPEVFVLNAWKEANIVFNNFKNSIHNGDYIQELIKIDKNKKHKLAPKIFKSQISENIKGKYPIHILLLGHPYNIYENYINNNLIDRLKSMDCKVSTIEKMDEKIFQNQVMIGNQYQQYWQTEDEILKTAKYFLTTKKNQIDGVIFLISFACGPDSLIQEIIMRDMKDNKIPFLALILDEHSGESGMITRIQALVEMVRRKKYQGVTQ